ARPLQELRMDGGKGGAHSREKRSPGNCCNSYQDSSHGELHSFPTRRSSDLEAGGSGEAHRLVEDDIVGRGALVDRGGVNIGLEGRADLAHRLSGAVELGVFEISPADHRFDLTTGVVDGNEGPLGA